MAQKKQLRTYDKIQQLPATKDQRKCSDVLCIVIGVTFTVIMLIIAAIGYNHQKYLKSNFPADTDGSLCGHELPQYQYLYFANLPQINQRICVQQCPKKGDKTMKCNPAGDVGCKISQTQKFSAKFYESQPHQTRGGFFCWPTSKDMQQQIYKRSNLYKRNSFYNSLDTIKISLWVALLVSAVFFVLVQFLPIIMNLVAVGLGTLILLITAICVFTYNTTFVKTKIFIGLFLLLLLIFFVLTIWKHFDSMQLHSIYLKWSTRMLKDRKLSIIYILIFILVLAGFAGLMIFQFAGFWTSGNLEFDSNTQIYHELTGAFPTAMMFFLVIQLIWGLSFVKQAFNFCISGNAVHWFLEQGKDDNHPNVKKSIWYPAILMITKHLGTVIAGAFMTGFFSVFDAIFDFLRPTSQQQNSCYNKFFWNVCCCCNNLFDFVRTDALAHVNLAGNPYCNSSRYCELLCRKSITVEYAQSSSRVYRLSAHFLVMGIVAVISLYILGNISIYAQLLVLLGTVFISTMFISYHADSAQAIQITLLTIQQLHYLSEKIVNDKSGGKHNQNLYLLKTEHIRVQLIDQIAAERQNIQNKKRERQGKGSLF